MNRFRSRGWRAALLGVAAVWALVASLSAQAATPLRVIVDETPLALIPAPAVFDDFLYLPLRALAKHFQATINATSQVIELRRTDGTAFTLRVGRLELWSDGIVVGLAEAPVRLVNGVTMIPRGAVEVLFDALVIWNRPDNTVVIVTQKAFKTAVTDKPLLPAANPVPAAARAREFVPEFRPDAERPLLASGYVTMGLATGSERGVIATSRLQFHTHTGPDRIDGSVAMATGSQGFQTVGTISLRRPTSTWTFGGFSLNSSPLTLYEQGMVGLMYQGSLWSLGANLFGANIPNSSTHVYGLSLALPPAGQWLFNGEFLYVPEHGAFILKARADRPLRPGLTLFGEAAGGMSGGGSGTAWRIGVTASMSQVTASVSYLSLSAGYPTVGNTSLFAGRDGPLVEVSYRPNPQWTFFASAAALSGASTGVPDRLTSSLLVQYTPSPSLGVVAEVRSTEDTSGGVRSRSTSAQFAVSFITGRWGLVAAANYSDDDNLQLGTSAGTSTFSLRAGYTLTNGVPIWAELSRQVGMTEAWGVGVGATLRVSSRLDLSAQVRHKIYTLPTSYTESALEVGVIRPLSDGAQLTLGAGLRYNTSSGGATTPYLALQYGYPVYVRGEARVGKLGGVMFIDSNGNGRWDPGEPGVPGVVLRINDRTAAMSNETGKVALEGIAEGEYRVSVDQDTIPAGLVLVQSEQVIKVAANETATLELALAPAAALRCVLFFDENGNGIRDRNEKGVGGVVLALRPSGRSSTAESDGTFDFLYLAAGEYTVIVDQRSLPTNVKVKGDGVYAVTLRPGATVVLEIPLVEGRPIINTLP